MDNDACLNKKDSTTDTDAAKTFIIISTRVSKVLRVIECFLKAWSHEIKLIKVNKSLRGKKISTNIDNTSKNSLAAKDSIYWFIMKNYYLKHEWKRSKFKNMNQIQKDERIPTTKATPAEAI